MPWPSIPTALIYTDTVQSRSVTWAQDAARGRVAAYGGWGPAVPCSVSAAGADDQAAHSREGMVVTHVVTCDSRLGSVRDQLLWPETGAILTIVGVVPAGDPTGRIWEHMVEEHPAR